MTQEEWDKCYPQIMNKWETPIFNYCYCMLNGDKFRAEDCLQNTFYCLYISKDKINNLDNIEKWLFKAAKNFVLKEHSQIKKDLKTVHLDDENIKQLSFEINFDEVMYDNEISKAKKDILLRLDKQELKLFYYYYRKKLPVIKIAEKLKISTWTIYKRKCLLDSKIKLIIFENFNDFDSKT